MLPHYENLLAGPDCRLFLGGACHVFALALQRRFKYPLLVARRLGDTLPKGAAHVFCEYDEARIVDVIGICPRADVWKGERLSSSEHEIEQVSELELRDFYTTEPGGGLYDEAEFLCQARSRAESRIDEYRDCYAGVIETPIPDAKRSEIASTESVLRIIEGSSGGGE